MSRLFGKNGIRGVAVKEFTCEMAMLIGRAVAVVMAKKDRKDNRREKFFIAKDTRNSADTLEAAICAGICSVGADAELLGVLPASALAWGVRQYHASGGIMITASHANSDFNGIKIFSSDGCRLDDGTEEEIERILTERLSDIEPDKCKEYGRISHREICQEYIEYMKRCFSVDISGLKVAFDCANGSAYRTAETLFRSLGVNAVFMGNEPDGRNINSCGSMHIETLMDFVVENRCDCGIAFDGSGERCLAVDEKGNLIDGDVIIALCARDMQRRDLLTGEKILVTQANNFGLVQFAKAREMEVVTAPAGERSMICKMIETKCSIGGDPSGHILFPEDMPSADGQLTAIKLLRILKKSGDPMSMLTGIVKKIPQVIMNVPIDKKYREIWKNDEFITDMIEKTENELGDDGRIIVRETGRDPVVIRIRIEGSDFSTINSMALEISGAIKKHTQNF